MGKREPQIILKTEGATFASNSDASENFDAKSSGWIENRVP
jgi:hypothetical protein